MAPYTPILSVTDLSIAFGGATPFVAVNKLSFTLDRGKTLAIVGESGSGKSLTSLALMGLLPRAATLSGSCSLQLGDRSLELLNLAPGDWAAIRGREISMVFQEPMSALNPIMKIGRQLLENITAHTTISKSKAKVIAISWLQKVQLPNPENIYNRYPHQLSGGQKQRVMLAMAMCLHPTLLIADEPTTALDVTVQRDVLLLMQSLQREHGTSMIFITHDLALAQDIADDVLVLYRGQVIEYGHVDKVLHLPSNPYTKALLACRPAAQEKGKRLPIVSDFLSSNGAPAPPRSNPSWISTIQDDTILSARDVRIWFPERAGIFAKSEGFFKAVDGVSFDLRHGEILGLVGESGCGKSTLSKCLMGLLPVHSGQILFDNRDLAILDNAGWRSMRKDIQMVFQDPYSSLNPRMTIGAMIEEPMIVHNIVPHQDLDKEARRLMELVQLPPDALKRYPHQFSGGQRQRIGIARALAVRPKLLICDESVSALDVSVQAQILNLLKDLQPEFDLSYVFISHDLNVVHYISDRVLVMQAGKIVESGSASQILRHPTHPYTQKLVASIP